MAEVADEPGPVRRAWRAWRRWRHTRPFWGGLLVVLGGLLILASERAPLPIVIHIGLQGLAGYLVPIIMVLVGLLLWFHPVQRLFYSLLAVVLSLGSWVTSNLGGFFVGMLLGLIGGSLAFAWVQRDRRDPARHRGEPQRKTTESVGIDLVRGDHGTDNQASDREGTGHRRSAGRHAAGAPGGQRRVAGSPGASATLPAHLVPLAPLALSALAALAARGLITGTMPVTTLASAPLIATPNPLVTPTGIPTWLRSPMPSPTPTASPTPSPRPSPDPSPDPSASPSPEPSPSATSPGKPAGHLGPVVKAAMPAAPVAGDKFGLTSRFAVLRGVSYGGIASVPTVHGVKQMLRFSMSYMKLPEIVLTATQDGHAFMTRDSSVELRGHVELYTTRLSGILNGIRVTFTSGDPPSGLRPDTTLANVVADQPFVTANSLRAIGSHAGSG